MEYLQHNSWQKCLLVIERPQAWNWFHVAVTSLSTEFKMKMNTKFCLRNIWVSPFEVPFNWFFSIQEQMIGKLAQHFTALCATHELFLKNSIRIEAEKCCFSLFWWTKINYTLRNFLFLSLLQKYSRPQVKSAFKNNIRSNSEMSYDFLESFKKLWFEIETSYFMTTWVMSGVDVVSWQIQTYLKLDCN